MEGIAFSGAWAFVWYEWVLVSTVPRASFSGAFVWYEWVLVSTVPRASFSGAFVWYEWVLVSTVPRALLVRPCIMLWRSGSRSSLVTCHIHANTLRSQREARCVGYACVLAEKWRSGGAEERR